MGQVRGMIDCCEGLLANRNRPLIAALGIATLYLALAWPGQLTPDSRTQLQQAVSGRFDDWHPPFMAMLWRVIGATAPAMLVLQVGLHWFGIWLFAEGVRRERGGAWPYAVLAIGLTPIALKYVGVLQKDSLLAGFLLVGFGLAFLIPQRAFGWPFGVAAGLCRANGSFALAPLLFERLSARMGTVVTVVAALALSIAAVPTIGLFNTRVLGATETGVARSVQLFDLAGIVHHGGDPAVLPRGADHAASCYTPLFWDSLTHCVAPLSSIEPSLTRHWLSAIVRYPLAYAVHRIDHFNRSSFFIVPPMQQCVEAPSHHRCDFSTRGRVRDMVEKNALMWPVTWLVVGSMLLAAPLHRIARALVLSGLLYGFAYLIVGVAADFRYFYWTELAVQLAIVFQLATRQRVANARSVVAATLLVWAIGYGARILLA